MKKRLLVFLITFLFVIYRGCESRIHHLVLNNDSREKITISTFGFLTGGVQQINVKKLAIDRSIKFDQVKNSV
jgi:hypothetical protein